MVEAESSFDNTQELEAASTRGKNRSVVMKVGVFIASSVFWLWQIAFVIFSLFLVLPDLLPSIWVSYFYFDMPVHNFLLTVSLILLPLLCLGVIAWLAIVGGGQRAKLILKFFYGFELPALFLLAVYLTNLRDYGAGVNWLLVNAGIALCFWFVLVVRECKASDSSVPILPLNSAVLMVGSTIVFAVGLYVSIALLLFVVPALTAFVVLLIEGVQHISWSLLNFSGFWDSFISMEWLMALTFKVVIYSIPVFAALALGITSTVLIMALPFVLIYLYIGQFVVRLRHSTSSLNALMAVAVLTILLGVHVMLGNQSQQSVFALLELDTRSDKDQRYLIDQQDHIRDGLLNAYLSRYRYVSSTKTATLLQEIYRRTFSLDRHTANGPQKLFNLMLKPVLYDGDNRHDAERAEKLYEQYFDAPIQKAEVDAIWDTLKFNGESSLQNAAGLLDVSQESVYLESQSIDINVNQQLASVRVTQKLVNKVLRQREAVVHFSLPEYAVVTGVWLSNNKNELEQHAGLVAPRGAAQTVYNQQVAQRIDPALLEKVGPELYRLRVYPILPATKVNKREMRDGQPMYVTFEYQTLSNAKGAWPMPKLLEKRHLFWNENTVDVVNDEPIKRANEADWIPREAGLQQVVTQSVVEIPAESTDSVWAVPRSYLQTGSNMRAQADVVSNLVVLIDGSRSMQNLSDEVLAAVNQLPGASIYFCKKACVKTNASDISERVFWGNSKPIEQLESYYSDAAGSEPYGIVLLTDDGSYESELDEQPVVTSSSPIWVHHVGDSTPYAYSDSWLTTVNQSGGGFTTGDVGELLQRLVTKSRGNQVQLSGAGMDKVIGKTLTSMNEDWLWFDAVAATNNPHIETYSKLGAAMEIRRATKTGATLELALMDKLHSQAIRASIVTELSSMIVLINQQQKKALEDASKEDDRFDRENENGTQMVSAPQDNLSVAAVPEPEEWALLLIVLAFLTISLHRRRVDTYQASRLKRF